MGQQQEFSAVSLPNNVTDAIRDMLPAQVGTILRDELKRGENAQRDLGAANQEIEKLQIGVLAKANLKKREKHCENWEIDLKKQADELAVETMGLRVKDLELEIKLQARYSDRLEGALAGLVRNTEWRETVHQFETATSYNKHGGTDKKTPKDKTTEAT